MAPIEAVATIIDDGGELNNNVLNHVGIICKINTGFFIGFDPVSYNASEPDGINCNSESEAFRRKHQSWKKHPSPAHNS